MIVAYRHEQFFHAQFVHEIGANRTRDTRRELPGTAAGELIIGFGGFDTEPMEVAEKWLINRCG